MAELRKDRCGTCRFWEREGALKNAGLCHRFPPVLITQTWDSESFKSLVEFPTILDDDWCGEWQPLPGLGTVEGQLFRGGEHDMDWWRGQGLGARERKAIACAVGGGRRAQVFSLHDLCQLTVHQLWAVRGCGPSTIQLIRLWLAARGLCLKDE